MYIGEAGWKDDGQAFLFISSNDYGGDFKILQSDYAFLTKPISYVSCNGIVVYPASELGGYTPIKVGNLRPADAVALHSALAGSDTMEQWQIQLCCRAVAGLIS